MNSETDIANDTGTTSDAETKPKLDLTVKVNETNACQRHVVVTIPRADIDRYFGEKFDELVPLAEVPGFRAGKAPRRLVESKFRPQVEDQVKGALLVDALAQISDEETFSAISEPDFDFETIKVPDDGPMTFEFNIEVRPEFELPEWKGLTLTRSEFEFSDDDVDKEIAKFARNSNDLVPVDEPAQDGDYLVVDIESRMDGEVLASDSEVLVEVQEKLLLSDATVEGFGELVRGARSGDKKTTTVKITEYAEDDGLHGKEVEIEFEILDVKRPDVQDVNKIAKSLGFDDAEKLREIVRKNLENQAKYEQRQEIRTQISDLLTESANWALPQDLLRRQSRRELERSVMELRSSGFSEDAIRAQESYLRQNVLQRTETKLKEHFILERIAEIENVEETDADFEMEIAKLAIQRNDSPRRVRARLERTGQMDVLRNMIIEQKVLAMIEEHATIESKPRSQENSGNSVAAIEFFACGRESEAAIPQAKYDNKEESSLPTSSE